MTEREAARASALPAILIALTVVTGVVDAVSYVRLGHVFVSNMTGNVVFLGFALAGAGDVAPLRSLAAIAIFALGAAAGGRIGARFPGRRARVVAVTIGAESLLLLAALGVALRAGTAHAQAAGYAQVVLLALAMGLQNAAARTAGVADLTTTVVTLTLTALASESPLGTGTNRNAGRRAAAIGAMFAGAFMGGAIVLHGGVAPALAVALALLAAGGVAAVRAHDE